MHSLPYLILVACPDQGADNDLEALGSVHSPLEELKQNTDGLGKD